MDDIFEKPKATEIYDGNTTLQPSGSHEGRLSSTFATAEIPPDVADGPEHSEDEYHKEGSGDVNYGYNSSSSSRLSGHDSLEDDFDDDAPHVQSAASSRSSISSIPGSVIIHPMDCSQTPTTSDLKKMGNGYDTPGGDRSEKRDGSMRFMPRVRDHQPAFRKPSSVRAMQMHTEDEDDDYLSPPRRRGVGHSPRHSETSPTKRSPYHSPHGSAHKPKVKKEYPLVLLHCNLLPPSLSLPAGAGVPNAQILQEVLPPRYWRRWKLLEAKVIGSGVLRDRGVLISHPQDAYDVLEERLLESLELARPRLRDGHFLAREENDTEKEDSENDARSDVESEEGEECPDCGGRVVDHKDSGRKWEIKVYAANGLMRAGAWAAAWKEMEKVDVEVGLWLPSQIRRELEKRILEERAICYEEECHVSENEKRHSNRYEAPSMPSQEQIDGFDDAPRFNEEHFNVPQAEPLRREKVPMPPGYDPKIVKEIELHTLLINYIRVLASDRRNVSIVILSMLVVFFAFGARPAHSDVVHFQPETVEYVLTPTVSVTQNPSANYMFASQSEPKVETAVGPAVQVESEKSLAPVSVQSSFTSSTLVAEEVTSKIDYTLPVPIPTVSPADSPAAADLDDPDAVTAAQLPEAENKFPLLDAA